ncbi:MAG: hypothetical protein JWM82_3666, partial [Myxococcales bacterium]|nr:hypothetical protein [Myxococcales bacterium]
VSTGAIPGGAGGPGLATDTVADLKV